VGALENSCGTISKLEYIEAMAQEPRTILIVDDDAAVAKVLRALLKQAEIDSHWVPSAEAALEYVKTRAVDVVLSDVRMEGMDGVGLLRELSARIPDLPVILMTAHGSVPLAVEAMKAGAADFLMKPFERDELLFVVNKALERVHRESNKAPQVQGTAGGIAGMVGSGLNEVSTIIRKVASNSATVLVRGETGTGKEAIARALHDEGSRKNEPFISVHCASLPDTLLESELFGYEKGAFTGANARKPGRLELAHRGTLFLDEIGDIAPHVQVKLLRVLQEREFERIGGTQTLKVDVRFVAATHRDLDAMVRDLSFREDLFYRLNVVSIQVPPLRDRKGDIEALGTHFAQHLGQQHGRPKAHLTQAALERLRTHAWPGNVRQLRNLIERLVVLADVDAIDVEHVEKELSDSPVGVASSELGTHVASTSVAATGALHDQIRGAERAAIENALARSGNNRTLAARLLNVSRRTFYNKLKELGLE
jgi:DNA-binding NtrC family response regulator